MTNFFSKLFKGDHILWITYLLLCLMSLLEVYSATSTLGYSMKNTFAPVVKHGIFLIIGTGFVIVIHQFNYKYLSVFGLGGILISIVLFCLTPFLGVRINDATRWIDIFGIKFQPSEVAKLSMVLFTAFLLSRTQRKKEDRDLAFWIILITTFILALFIVRENLSTALLFSLVIFCMMIIGRVSAKKLWILGGSVFAISCLGLLLLKVIPADKVEFMPRWETWQNRIIGEKVTVKDVNFRINDENRQISHGKMAIANGKFFGTLPGNSTQRDFLPQAYSDFIYAIIIEEWGWIGMLLVPLLYLMIMYRALSIARKCKKIFPMLLVMGCALMISFQGFINMLVAVGAGPVTGQPLPLISKGGTTTIITCCFVGIMLSVSRFGTKTEEELKIEDIKEVNPELHKMVDNVSEEYGV